MYTMFTPICTPVYTHCVCSDFERMIVMELLSVNGLCKDYGKFKLSDVSFSLESGYIMGFIGRNGAGKTTTLKSMLGLVSPNGGKVEICGKDISENGLECLSEIGVVFGEFDYYGQKTLRKITNVYKTFYKNWDDEAYRNYLEKFSLDEEKCVKELSAGMKVKYSLALAMSHGAKLLILDEPTSGLDPISRDELMDVFRSIIEDGEHSILFSTHITSDLESCADYITYIKNGRIVFSKESVLLRDEYMIVKGAKSTLDGDFAGKLIGVRENVFGIEALINSADAEEAKAAGFEVFPANIESVMIHLEKDERF